MVKYSDSLVLNTGIEIPKIGIGTGIVSLGFGRSVVKDLFLNNGKEIKKQIDLTNVIHESIRNGCLLFDTASAYGKSEYILGKAIKRFSREKVFIISKLSNSDQRKGNVRNALMQSLKAMNLKYLDLYLLHWPQTDTFLNSWAQMEELFEEGLVRSIGVSNFHKHHLEELGSIAHVMPAVNEFECHPLLSQKELIKYCSTLGIKVIAYTPIGRMHANLKDNTVLLSLSKKYDKSIAQIILRWHFQNNIITIPHTLKVERVREYLDIYDFKLSEEEILLIDSINQDLRLRFDPDNCDFSKL